MLRLARLRTAALRAPPCSAQWRAAPCAPARFMCGGNSNVERGGMFMQPGATQGEGGGHGTAMEAHNLMTDESLLDKVIINSARRSGGFRVNDVIIPHSIIAFPRKCLVWSPNTLQDITIASLSIVKLMNPRPEHLLVGTGDKGIMLAPEIEKYLNDNDISFEVMDSTSAFSTFNFLNSDERRVAAVLLQRGDHPSSSGNSGTAKTTQAVKGQRSWER